MSFRKSVSTCLGRFCYSLHFPMAFSNPALWARSAPPSHWFAPAAFRRSHAPRAHSGQRDVLLLTGAANQQRHPPQRLFTMPGRGSHGSSLIGVTRRCRPSPWSMVPTRSPH